ncbi:hypothetical protein SpCBS45565_g04449 [Spizellomyces sp. 'palustris']|nr:hypothetical protein SpCBS45565_g04449 [Spizellomyces sp. 'palustris']
MGLISALKNAGQHHSNNEKTSNADADSTAAASSTPQPTTTTNTSSANPTAGASEYCHTQNAPVTRENVHEHHATEVTPVVSRERDETIVQQSVQPIHDHVEAETQHHYAQNAGIARESSEELNAEDARRYQENRELVTGGRTVEQSNEGVRVSAPIVKEKVNKHVIEEVQPVIERTIDQTHVVHTAQPIYEHQTAAPKVADLRYNNPISMEEFEKRGGSMSGTGLSCERR